MKEQIQKPIIIAGPCAAESHEQVMQSAVEAKKRGVDAMRMSLWKPRTEPGFSGVNGTGIPWLVEVAQMGVVPATEVPDPHLAEKVIDAVIKNSDSEIIIWIGSRNQNHEIQQGIGSVVKGESRVTLMVKNQMWPDERHWKGAVKHVLTGGASEEQLILIHRGFAPGSNGFRNTPDLDMARRVQKDTRLRMLIDPSHIGGNVKSVLEIATQALTPDLEGGSFDGLIIEVHPNPLDAQTDKDQQLSWDQFDALIGEHVVFHQKTPALR